MSYWIELFTQFFCLTPWPYFFPSYYCPSYTPSPLMPQIYVDYSSSHLPLYPPDVSATQMFSSLLGQAVPSPPYTKSLVAAICAPCCTKGWGGVGRWNSLSLVTSLTSQSHTIQSIPESALIWVVCIISLLRKMPPLRELRLQIRPWK